MIQFTHVSSLFKNGLPLNRLWKFDSSDSLYEGFTTHSETYTMEKFINKVVKRCMCMYVSSSTPFGIVRTNELMAPKSINPYHPDLNLWWVSQYLVWVAFVKNVKIRTWLMKVKVHISGSFCNA